MTGKERQVKMTDEARKTLIKAQQGELDGVETYLMLAEVVHNEDDVKAFKELAADEGRHAAVFKNIKHRHLPWRFFIPFSVRRYCIP